MKVIIEIPKEYETEYDTDHFAETLMRIEGDVKAYRYDKGGFGLSGFYEDETLSMMRNAWGNAKQVIEKDMDAIPIEWIEKWLDKTTGTRDGGDISQLPEQLKFAIGMINLMEMEWEKENEESSNSD